ncbi:MAG TPA: hypothetical protein VHV55_18190 [Pirellulales bacterium]|jgi:hypothetical protein|nr:hypothetical protein [Pirellulales bacterium]
MKPFRLLVLVAPLVGTLLLAGCERHSSIDRSRDSLASQIGRPCRVQLRRDALGMAGSHPIAPLATGADVDIEGTLMALDGEFLILRGKHDKKVVWVPQSTVLLVHFDEGE